jgi:hypothetical protein
MGDPVQFTNLMKLPRPGGNVQLPMAGLAEPGMLLYGPEGRRMLYGTADTSVVFIRADTSGVRMASAGQIYYQSQHSFQYDVGKYGPLAEAGRRLSSTQEVIKDFLDVFTGIVATVGGPVAWGIAGMNVVVTAGKIKQEYSAYAKVFETILYHYDFLFQRVPAFTSTMLGECLAGVLQDKAINYGKGVVSSAIPGAAGKIVGVILGQMGESRMNNRLKAISTLLKEVLIKIAVRQSEVYPQKLTPEQITGLAEKVRQYLADVTEFEVKAIVRTAMVRETGDNPLSLEARYRAISKAIDAVT